MKRVAILSFDHVALFELGCAVELFALPRNDIADWYSTDVVNFSEQPVSTTAGITLTSQSIQTLDAYSMLVIPSWPTQGLPIPAQISAQVTEFAKRTDTITISFCSGAFLLAELDLLNGRLATTHWQYAELFQQRFPHVQYAHDVLYVLDQRFGCSAGSAAGIDLGLAVIRQDYGLAVANQVARRLVMSPHRKGGQSQFVETPVAQPHSRLSETLDWALSQLTEPLEVAAMASHAGMSRRSFDRHFRRSIGCSAKEWLITQRLALARQLLEQSSTSIEQVASACGFESAATLRHHFSKALGVSPRQYRDQFAH